VTTENTGKTSPISAQQPAFDVLNSLAAQYPTLPAGYVTLHAPFDGRLGTLRLQMDTSSDFEAWRDALEIPPNDVALFSHGTYIWLETTTTVLDVTVEFSGGIPLAFAALGAPRDREDVAA